MKEFLSQKQIEFTERNIQKDREAMRDLLDLGFQTTPVTVIDGEAVVGFDEEKLTALLG